MSHTLRSGRSFKASSSQIMSEESVAELKNALDEERRQREADWARLEEERKSREREFELERHKREEERAKEKAFYEEEIRRGADERLIEQRRQDEQVTGWLKKILNEVPRDRPRENEGPKLAKLTDSDDIEAFLTTFERIMQAFEVAKKRWSYKLAPQLSGKAQQAYAAMERHKADDYEEVKKAILQRYNITEETYRQRFRSARRSEGETYQNLAFRLSDMAQKWTKECGTICNENFYPRAKNHPRTIISNVLPAVNCPSPRNLVRHVYVSVCLRLRVEEVCGEDLVELACQYISKKVYPDGCSASKKRQIRQRAKRFTIVDGEVFYKLGAEQVSLRLSTSNGLYV